MARCLVCGRSPATTLRTAGGSPYGPACDDGTCQCLAWEGHFNAVAGAGAEANELLAWEMRRQRARIKGEAFDEPAPQSTAERELNAVLVNAGLDDLAREME